MVTKKTRVRMHLIDQPGASLPSVEGVLLSRRRSEYLLAVPKLIHDVSGNPTELEHMLAIPRDRVAFFEVIR